MGKKKDMKKDKGNDAVSIHISTRKEEDFIQAIDTTDGCSFGSSWGSEQKDTRREYEEIKEC